VPNLLNQDQLKELVSIAAEKLGIRYPSILEKDYYVTRIIHALSDILALNFFKNCSHTGSMLRFLKKILKRPCLKTGRFRKFRRYT